MKHDKTVKYIDQLGVWFRYRSTGSNDVSSLFLSGVEANRLLRKILKKQHQSYIDLNTATQRCHSTLDYLHVEGVYEHDYTKDSKITILRGTKGDETRRRTRYIPEGITTRTVRDTFKHMAFHASKLDNAVLLFCPTTGICGTLEMPALPVALVYTHPLATVGNALACIRAIAGENVIKRIEHQVYAGLVLSLLKGKELIRKAEGETTAAEQNMVLQGAGNLVLHSLCSTIARLWDNVNVWDKVPSLNVDWSVHAKVNYGGVNIAQVLQAYTRIIQDTLNPLALTSEDQARYMSAKRDRTTWLGHGRPPSYIKIHSASAVQARNIKDSKVQARKMYDNIQYSLPVITRILIGKVIKDLMILPERHKQSAAEKLEDASDNMPALQAAVALELAEVIRQAKNERILDEMGSFMQEVSPKPIKSIAEILEQKRIAREEKEVSGE